MNAILSINADTADRWVWHVMLMLLPLALVL
jgi:hypothetical protein